MPEQPEPGRALHEFAASWIPTEPETHGTPEDYAMAKGAKEAERRGHGPSLAQAAARAQPPTMTRSQNSLCSGSADERG
jgi:hypothetical protein